MDEVPPPPLKPLPPPPPPLPLGKEDPVAPPDSEAITQLALLLVLGSAELDRLGEREELVVPTLPVKDTES